MCQHDQLSQLDESVDRIDGMVMSLDQRLERIDRNVRAVAVLLARMTAVNEFFAIEGGRLDMLMQRNLDARFPFPELAE